LDFTIRTVGRNSYFIPGYATHRPACKNLLKGKLHEPRTHKLVDLVMRYRPGNMVHAGTFFGDMLPSFSAKCPGTVFAFEPVLENYILAKLTVLENNLGNVLLSNSALGSAYAISSIEVANENGTHKGGSSTVRSQIVSDAQHQLVTILPIDSLPHENLTLFHLDVEGFELQALAGAERIIQKNKPVLLLEDNLNNCRDFLQNHGYTHLGSTPSIAAYAHSNDAAEGLRREIEEVMSLEGKPSA
jgi:FkbM family methyltransferase